jgi:hypothetical protein
MWLRLSNGRNELVVNEDHVRRLLAEGGVEIPDPRLKPEETPLSVEPDQERKQSLPDTDIGSEEEVTQQLPAPKKLSKRPTKSARE